MAAALRGFRPLRCTRAVFLSCGGRSPACLSVCLPEPGLFVPPPSPFHCRALRAFSCDMVPGGGDDHGFQRGDIGVHESGGAGGRPLPAEGDVGPWGPEGRPDLQRRPELVQGSRGVDSCGERSRIRALIARALRRACSKDWANGDDGALGIESPLWERWRGDGRPRWLALVGAERRR